MYSNLKVKGFTEVIGQIIADVKQMVINCISILSAAGATVIWSVSIYSLKGIGFTVYWVDDDNLETLQPMLAERKQFTILAIHS